MVNPFVKLLSLTLDIVNVVEDYMSVVKVYRKGIIVLPKSVREKAGIEEGMLLEVVVDDGKIILKPLDLWDRVWGCGKGMGSAEEAERELDHEEDKFWRRRLEK